jgi:hypothetical protein
MGSGWVGETSKKLQQRQSNSRSPSGMTTKKQQQESKDEIQGFFAPFRMTTFVFTPLV